MISQLLQYVVVGFAIFAMFFGAGNLVYPVYIGTQTFPNYFSSIMGLALTGIILPFLGLVSTALNKGSVKKFFQSIGNYTSLPLILIILALIGPTGGIPRCIIISYGGIKTLFESAELLWFNLLFCLLLLGLASHRGKTVDILGKFLTPVLIVGVIIIILCALLHDNGVNQDHIDNVNFLSAFKFSSVQGYQTMDLCAAIFFGVLACDYIKKNYQDNVIRHATISFIIGLSLLFVVYGCFVYIGGKYLPILSQVPPEQMLTAITYKAVGKLAAPVIATTIFIACLTTALALLDLVSNWVVNEFKILNQKLVIVLIVFISFTAALMGFNGLTRFLSQVLFFLYPGLIVITVGNILNYFFNIKSQVEKLVFWFVLVVNIIYNFY